MTVRAATEKNAVNEKRPNKTRHLKLFDKLAFEAFNKENWKLFAELHTDDVIAESAGVKTKGIAAHVVAVKEFLAATPGGKVVAHPVSFGSGEWTCTRRC